mmetsp:Transcript_37556/g.83635  ORF Transcript_37556/g.83635 Transcript_37556/m.83635 type:complete len:86 (-) Transcript_37556:968-1225(-)
MTLSHTPCCKDGNTAGMVRAGRCTYLAAITVPAHSFIMALVYDWHLRGSVMPIMLAALLSSRLQRHEQPAARCLLVNGWACLAPG